MNTIKSILTAVALLVAFTLIMVGENPLGGVALAVGIVLFFFLVSRLPERALIRRCFGV